MSTLNILATLLINVFFNLYIFVLLVRLLLQKLGANWHNPICQFIIKITEPVLKPLRNIIPGFKGFDTSIIIVCFILEMVELYLLLKLQIGHFPGLPGAFIIAIGALGTKIVNVYLYAVIISAIASWFPMLQQSPLVEIVNLITYPPLNLIRRYIRPVSGFDLSSLFFILILIVIHLLILNPIITLGMRLAFN